MITDDELKKILASAPDDKTWVELIELSAPWFSKTYYCQGQVEEDLMQFKLETGQIVTAEFVPMTLSQSDSNMDLNNERTVSIHFVNDIIGSEMDRWDPSKDEFPTIKSRLYIRYEDNTTSDLKSAVTKLRVKDLTTVGTGARISASTKLVNTTSTGLTYNNSTFPMLKGYD